MLNKGTTDTIFILSWYDAVLDWGLNPGPPVLEASTIPLGYRGGGIMYIKNPLQVSFISVYTTSENMVLLYGMRHNEAKCNSVTVMANHTSPL